jgi:DMATS type aromatic prenyltransferase
MGGGTPSLYEHVREQARTLCDILGLAPDPVLAYVSDLLRPFNGQALTGPPLWPSDISDDHTPVEFSIACAAGAPPTLRILGETIAAQPAHRDNANAALRLVDSFTDRLDLSLNRFHEVCPLFVGADPRGDFSMWFSLVYRPGAAPDVKIYFDPKAQGAARAPRLVADALDRLGLNGAYRTAITYGIRPGEFGGRDRFSFFALDLHARRHSRVKVYLAHHDADAEDVARAAGAVPGVDPDHLRDFLALTGCTGPLTRRPPMSGYTFVEGDAGRPSGYSLYLPIRDYVGDDAQALDRVRAVFDHLDLDSTVIDRAIAGIARRPLHAGVGLIAHLSLRLHPGRAPSVGVYLSSEAYRVTPPRLPVTITPDPRVPAHTASQRCH